MQVLHHMDGVSILKYSYIYVALLQGCTTMKALVEGKQVHAHIVRSGIELNIILGTTLINTYAKCGSMDDANQIFNKMPERHVFTWNAMILAYATFGDTEEAWKLFTRMENEGMKPDKVTYLSILKAFASPPHLEQGKQVHDIITCSGFVSDVFVDSTLVDMYSKCGSIQDARQVFDSMPKPNVVSWTAMIGGYTKHGDADEALKLFWKMKSAAVKPNEVTFLSLLNACAAVGNLEQGKQIHAYVVKNGIKPNIYMQNMLLSMYAECGCIEDAQKLFDKMLNKDAVSWNAIIGGYTKQGHSEEILKLFKQMEQEGVEPDEGIFLSILNTCSSLGNLELGKKTHDQIMKTRFESHIYVGSTLVDMYAKCGSIEDACFVFENMPARNVITWTVMIAAYSIHENVERALQLFHQMERDGLRPDELTFVSILSACANLAALGEGRHIHATIIEKGLESDTFVGNALMYMYAKCGCLMEAHQLLDRISEPNVVSWTTVIAGYAQHGHGKMVLQLVDKMQRKGVQLNHVTFVSVISACSHSGLVEEGCGYFELMCQEHGITPTSDHYVCMVDLLGRAGRLEAANELISNMPFQPSAVVWRALLGACRIHGNINLAEHAAECILKLEPENSAACVLLSNMYGAAGKWEDRADLVKLKKNPGHRSINIDSQLHAFVEDDKSYPRITQLHAELSVQMEEAAYMPDMHCLIHVARPRGIYLLSQ